VPVKPAPANAVVGATIEHDDARTVMAFDLGGPVEASVRSLSNPPRVIVDLPETEFRLPEEARSQASGLVKAYRYGLIDQGKSRIVIDTTDPVRVDRSEVVLAEAGGAFRLEIVMAKVTERELAAVELAEAVRSIEPSAMVEAETKGRSGPPPRPVIVVDPGHGGIDPGALGSQSSEKDLVLAVSRQIERALLATGRYEVAMTRNRDVFVSLDERVAMSRRLSADLFLSVHADSAPSRDRAPAIRGATIYTLAEQASDDLVRQKAEKENSVDLLAGLPASTIADDQVRNILLDLMRRETQSFATDFRQTLVSSLRDRVLLARDPMRSGPFKVLRQAGSPAVLLELGYISNADDERIMQQPDWQARVASSIVRAIDAHFRDRTAARR
jgi:N-acetylmuramoyl-L-alanine amidase